MNWTKEEERSLCGGRDFVTTNDALAIASKAVALVAARGGTMTAEQLRATIKRIDGHGARTEADAIFMDMAAQGARVAALEQHASDLEKLLEHTRKERDEALARLTPSGQVTEDESEVGQWIPGKAGDARDALSRLAAGAQQVDAIRKRSLEAANLKRMVAEKGLPAMLRYVVDGATTHVTRVVHVAMPVCGCCTRAPCKCPGGPRWPCAVGCNHPDSWVAGHPERVKERSEAFKEAVGAKQCPLCRGTGQCNDVDRWPNPTRVTPETCIACDGVGTVEEEASHPPSPTRADPSLSATEAACYENGAEAMRAACWEACQKWLAEHGMPPALASLKAAIEGSTP